MIHQDWEFDKNWLWKNFSTAFTYNHRSITAPFNSSFSRILYSLSMNSTTASLPSTTEFARKRLLSNDRKFERATPLWFSPAAPTTTGQSKTFSLSRTLRPYRSTPTFYPQQTPTNPKDYEPGLVASLQRLPIHQSKFSIDWIKHRI